MADNRAFEGLRGRVAATVMARMNRDMEAAGLALLGPVDGERVLVLGYGPGVGIGMLLDRCTPAQVVAVDPSAAMAGVARGRLGGRFGGRLPERSDGVPVAFVVGDVAALDPDEEPFDGVIAVNCHHLWAPLASSTAAVAARMATTGRLVSLTHDWAIGRVAPVGAWRDQVSAALRSAGLDEQWWGAGSYRSGAGTWVVARRRSVPGAARTEAHQVPAGRRVKGRH